MKPDCYSCAHRKDVPGSAHSKCQRGIDALFGRAPVPLVRGDAHGIRSGWFSFPFDFDPTWLEACNAHTPKDAAPC